MFKRQLSLLVFSSAILGAGFSNPAIAFEDEDARRAILELRSQLKMAGLSRLELSNQIQALQREITQLRGQLESLDHSAKQAASQQNYDDYGPNPQVGDPNEQRDYDNAINLFRQGEYEMAASALNNFASSYPRSVLTPAARFYEGSSYYAIRDFQGAISRLERMVSTYPQDAQAGDALLVVAGSQLELNNIEGSKQTLQRVIQQYPNSPAADTAQERLKMY
ncbi:Cell division coordinator CpoB [Oligella sp. MSHR50489EDL]|uniref:tol-pal system protein YbgF n=1 Tax=Oligella sp. MSHR50489EDL TaxID=3139409 RepID=UPI003D8191F9